MSLEDTFNSLESVKYQYGDEPYNLIIQNTNNLLLSYIKKHESELPPFYTILDSQITKVQSSCFEGKYLGVKKWN